MAEKDDLLRCPVCCGHGALRRSELAEHLAVAMKQLAIEPKQSEEPVAVAQAQDFAREVHSWKPDSSLWRRSPKE